MEGNPLDDNPTIKKINISEYAAGQSEVYIRFHWTGTWGYTWFIDDVCVTELLENDIAIEDAWISTENGSHMEDFLEINYLAT